MRMNESVKEDQIKLEMRAISPNVRDDSDDEDKASLGKRIP